MFNQNRQAGLRVHHLHHAGRQKELPPVRRSCAREHYHNTPDYQLGCHALPAESAARWLGKVLLMHFLHRQSGQTDPTLKSKLCRKLTWMCSGLRWWMEAVLLQGSQEGQ